MPLVAGVDSSTQACKVVIRDAASGERVREGWAPHPSGTSVAPARWWEALQAALAHAGGLQDVAALSIGAQQHGMVCLDETGAVVRDALLWNDTRSARAATDLVEEGGGAGAWAAAVGSVPVASFTVTKLRWLATHEPENAARVAAVCLPHDWLTWQLAGTSTVEGLTTDRSDASGTGYWSPADEAYRPDLLRLALGRDVMLPRVLRPSEPAGAAGDLMLAAGCGDNAASALGVAAGTGDVIVSIGTSGVVCSVTDHPTADPTGAVAGFAAATGDFLPLVCTLNAGRVLDVTARMLGVDADGLSALALSAPSGADGLVLVPYLEGERTPNRPDASAALHGLTLTTSTPAHLARAAVEGLLCGLADGLEALAAHDVPIHRVILVGGGARSAAVRQLAPGVLGHPVSVPAPGQYVADGAARQAAWMLSGSPDPPDWPLDAVESYRAEPQPDVRARYAEVRELTASRSTPSAASGHR